VNPRRSALLPTGRRAPGHRSKLLEQVGACLQPSAEIVIVVPSVCLDDEKRPQREQ
jgi:hypothetical protein